MKEPDIITNIVILHKGQRIGHIPGPFTPEELRTTNRVEATRHGPELWLDFKIGNFTTNSEEDFGHDYPTNPADREGW